MLRVGGDEEKAVEVPPLRQRTEDIPLLARHFVKLFTGEMGRVNTPTASSDWRCFFTRRIRSFRA